LAVCVGLVTECVPAGAAASRAQEIAENIGEKGPIALRMAKKAIQDGFHLSLEDSMKVEKDCYAVVCQTTDRREGLKAFAEKRKPVYKGE
jgi:methylglutaconyl-CoA hydratase